MLIRFGTRRGLVLESRQRAANRPHWREEWYFRNLGLDASAGKELRIFGLVPWTKQRYRTASERSWRTHWPLRRRLYTTLLVRYALVGAVIAAVMLAMLGHDAATGSISLRDTALVLQAGILIVRVGSFFLESDLATEFGMGANRALLTFEEEVARRYPAIGSGAGDATGLPRESIRLNGVSFAYPGMERPVLERLDLEISAGRSLAIVGLNGAGKTTLVKLLLRLYEPTAGGITVDGIDLRELDMDGWRRRIAPIFQDFVRYELPATDNIGLGAVERIADAGAVREAARRAGALEVLEDLPLGLASPLSGRSRGGSDLSGGQWQRVAIARALFALDAGASVLVLDEPTANLDVRAEVELFDNFLDLTAGVTTILISHRFSTVRRADRIVVLDGGRVVEDGTHAELLAAQGRYAQLFQLQAARFGRDDQFEAAP
jgi:ATP-binding cassette subfamily B protein